MKLIIPMAGRGTRVRPHSHVTPKPLLKVKGKNMIERIVDMFSRTLPRKIDEVVCVIGPDFGADIQRELEEICTSRGITPHLTVQEKALGTAHAVYCAEQYLDGEGIVVYADTLFDMEPGVNLDDADVIAWVKEVPDPRRFGIAIRKGDRVVAFEEKPQNPASNEALIGIYYVKDLSGLRREIKGLLDRDQRGPSGEYFLTDVFDNMLKAGVLFKTAQVTEWLDCGTIEALMDTTKYILDKERDQLHEGTVENSVILDPVYVAPGARVVNSVVGPYVTIEAGAEVHGATVRDSILFGHCRVEGATLANSLIGQHAKVRDIAGSLNIGDHSVVEG